MDGGLSPPWPQLLTRRHCIMAVRSDDLVPIKNPLLHRYWFEFEPPREANSPIGAITLSPWPPSGCGVTAYTLEDAQHLMHTQLGALGPIPPIRRVVEDVDLSTVDVLRRAMIIPVWRGVWYPLVTIYNLQES